jgi:signal transduction histidine kinase
MAKRYSIFLFAIALLLASTANSQQLSAPDLRKLNPQQKSEAWLTYSTNFFHKVIEKGIYSCFDSVLIVCKLGLELTPNEDFKKQSEYAYFIGHTYKVQLQYDSAFHYLSKSIRFAKSSKNSYYETLGIQQINYLYRFLGKNEATTPYIKRLKELLPQIKDDEVKDRILSALSEEYLSLGYYNSAISCIMNSLPLKEKILAKKNDYASRVSLGLAYVGLGNLYLELHQNRNALSNFKMAQPYFSNYAGGRIRLFANFEQVYLNLNSVDSAMVYYKKVYQEMAPEIYYSSADLSVVNRILANYYLKRNLEKAKKYSALTYDLAIKSENKEAMVYAMILMGNLNYASKNYKNAIAFLEKALPNSYPFSKDVYTDVNLRLAESYEKLGEYRKSIKFYKKYNTLTNEISHQKTDEEISKVEFKYKTLKKEEQIDNLSHQALIANRLLKQQRQLQVVLTIAMALAFLIVVLVYINSRNKHKANQLLRKVNEDLDSVNRRLFEANQSKTRLFSIISHDIRKPVSQLFSFLKIQQQTPEFISDKDRDKYQSSLIKSSTNLLDTLEDLLLWSKSQMEQFKVEEEEIEISTLINSVIRLMKAQADEKQITIVFEKSDFELVNSDFNLLLTIIRNLMQNAITHSFNETAIVIRTQFSSINEKIISIVNFGEVIPVEKMEALTGEITLQSKSSGYGLVLIKDLIAKINAKLIIKSTSEGGTEIQLIFQS